MEQSVLGKRKATTQGDLFGESKAATDVIHFLDNLPETTINVPSSCKIILNCVTNALDLVPEDTFRLNKYFAQDTLLHAGVAKFYFYALGGLTILAKRVTKANQVYIQKRFHAFLVSDGKPKYGFYPETTEIYANLLEWQTFIKDNPKLRQDLIRLVLDCDTINTTLKNLLAQVTMVYSYYGMSVLKLMEEYSLSLPNDAFRLPHVQNDIERFKVALAAAKEKIGINYQYSYVLNREELSNLKHVDYPDLYLATAMTGKLHRNFCNNFAVNGKIRPKSGTRVIQMAVARLSTMPGPLLTQEVIDTLFAMGIDISKSGLVVGQPIS